MSQDLPGEGDAGAHEKGGPVDGVGGEDVLADEVEVGGPPRVAGPDPVVGVGRRVGRDGAGGGEVVNEGVHPDVGDVILREGQGDPPLEPGRRPGDGEVAQRLLQEAEDLVPPHLGEDPVRVVLDVADQVFLEVAHAEEPVGLLDLLHGPSAVRAGLALAQVLLGPVALLVDAVPPGVGALVDVAPVVEPLQESPDHGHVLVFGGADEAVEADVQRLPGRLEAGGHLVAELDGLHPPPCRLLLDLLPVLVGSREEADVVPVLPVEAGQHVAQDGGVGVPDVGLARGVVDGGGQVSAAHVRSLPAVVLPPRP